MAGTISVLVGALFFMFSVVGMFVDVVGEAETVDVVAGTGNAALELGIDGLDCEMSLMNI